MKYVLYEIITQHLACKFSCWGKCIFTEYDQSKRAISFTKKKTYALKTPHVVFLPFVFPSCFFGRSILEHLRKTRTAEKPKKKLQRSHVLRAYFATIILPTTHKRTFLGLVTLTYDLRTWPRYFQPWPTCRNSSLYVCLFGQDSEIDVRTDTHTHTLRQRQNYYTLRWRGV